MNQEDKLKDMISHTMEQILPIMGKELTTDGLTPDTKASYCFSIGGHVATNMIINTIEHFKDIYGDKTISFDVMVEDYRKHLSESVKKAYESKYKNIEEAQYEEI